MVMVLLVVARVPVLTQFMAVAMTPVQPITMVEVAAAAAVLSVAWTEPWLSKEILGA
jgi:hypothetical protein